MEKQDRRIRKTKAALRKALLDLMKNKKFNQITINEIAKKADLNRGTIYSHYSDKYDLLEDYIQEKLSVLEKMSEPIDNDLSYEQLNRSFEVIYGFFYDNKDFFKTMLSQGAEIQFQEFFRKLISKKISEMPIYNPKKYDKEFFTQFRINSLLGVIEWAIKEDFPLNVQEMSRNSTILLLSNE